jgi:hypothetical protein
VRLKAVYDSWLAHRERAGEEGRLELALGWSKGLSVEHSTARGRAEIDLATGGVQMEVTGLAPGRDFDAWLVDNRSVPGDSVTPEPGDGMVRLGPLVEGAGAARLRVDLPAAFFESFEVDVVVVTRGRENPTEGGLLFGVPSLFQRLEARRAQPPAPASGDAFLFAPMTAHAAPGAFPAGFDFLVDQGSDLFFLETFAGNGRTCGTCHPAENNFTIDPKFIATLSPTSPLFVAEFRPALAVNFEKPLLMRELGLILENVDGFGDLARKFVMRGVPHTLAMGTSLTPAENGADGTTVPPFQRTGWAGDGAPGGGTLREFAIGAVTQHFTRRLGRVPGRDFRLPTDEELDALEAFQLSLGRQEDLDLASLRPRGLLARRGKEIFLARDTAAGTVAAGKCNVCHANAGATLSGAPGGLNFNFDTGVEALPDHPADLVQPGARRPDGGFGTSPHPARPGAFGNGSFNTPTLVEAADTGPFFHNNVLETLEDAVAFYNSQSFNRSPAGRFLASQDSGGVGIQLEPTQVRAVAAFLRVLNALENIREAIALQRAVLAGSCTRADDDIRRSVVELGDAIEVLEAARLHPETVPRLRLAAELAQSAIGQPSFSILATAIAIEEDAQRELVE